jgi:hypothetical protein
MLEAIKPAVLVEFESKMMAGLNPVPFGCAPGQSFYNEWPGGLVQQLGDHKDASANA